MHALLIALAISAAPPAVQLWLETGGNFEPQGNERFIVKVTGQVLYERGRVVKTAKGLTTTCERFVWLPSDAQQTSLRQAVAAADLTALEPSYVDSTAHDGRQAGLVADLGGRKVISTFSNRFPPQYQAVAVALRQLVDAMPKGVTAQRCDSETWFFLAPPTR